MKLTIFTPVYNRADLIDRLYESLRCQTNYDFIWLVVDDGSTDNLRQKIDQLKNESDFKIRYYYQKNQGKHVAHNTGVEKCDTELFFCVDSDDFLTEDAVEKILTVHETNLSCNVLGYYFRKVDTEGNVSGGKFFIRNNVVGLREIYYKYGFVGELAIVLKTDLIKGFSFPTYANEKFVSEKVLYNQLTSIAPMVYVDEAIYIFEYQESGYTMNSNKLLAKNPKGAAMGFLSDAVYGTNFIDMAKAYTSFLSIKKTFGICGEIYPKYSVKASLRIMAVLLKPHYNRLFQKINLRYNMEER